MGRPGHTDKSGEGRRSRSEEGLEFTEQRAARPRKVDSHLSPSRLPGLDLCSSPDCLSFYRSFFDHRSKAQRKQASSLSVSDADRMPSSPRRMWRWTVASLSHFTAEGTLRPVAAKSAWDGERSKSVGCGIRETSEERKRCEYDCPALHR